MIALLLALQTAALPPVAPALAAPLLPVLGPIGPQALPAGGCAAFLWSSGEHPALVAMAVANPARLRLALDGAGPTDLALTGAGEGTPSFGFAPIGAYVASDVTATLAMTIATQNDLTAGAVAQGSLTVERPGKDVLVLPVAGLIGCGS